MKAVEPHVVTLSAAALAPLEQAKQIRSKASDLVFPATCGQRLTDMALLQIVNLRGVGCWSDDFDTVEELGSWVHKRGGRR
jgi:hypothetical protein